VLPTCPVYTPPQGGSEESEQKDQF
jgi:hypothetical protein